MQPTAEFPLLQLTKMLHLPLNHQHFQSEATPILAWPQCFANDEASEAPKLFWTPGDPPEQTEAPPLMVSPTSLGGVRPSSQNTETRWPGLAVALLGYALAIGASLSWQSGLSGQAIPVYDEPIEVEIIIERPAEASPEPATVTETIREEVKTEVAEPPSGSSPDPQPTLQAETHEPVQAPVPPKPKEPVKSAKAQQSSKQARSGDNASLIDAYRLQVAAQIARNKPANSFATTAQGVALVSFTIAQDGQAGSIKLTQSSGNSTLDQEAIATIKRSSPFPAPPALATRTFTVPIRFQTRS